MALRKGFPAKLAGTDTNDTRYDFNNLVVCNADGSPRGGITAPLTALISSTGTMNVTVAAFSAVSVRDGGVVFIANDGPVSVLIGTAPVANSRLDVIWAKQDDASGTVTTPDGDNAPVFGVLAGVASATPVRNPAGIPAGAVEVGTILVPSTATATNSSGVVITQPPQYTAASGGVVHFPAWATLNAWTTARDGQLAYAADLGSLWQYVASASGGAAWVHVSGRAVVTVPTFTTIYSSSAVSAAGISTRNGRVFLDGAFTTSGATFAAATTYTIGSVPFALAPGSPAKYTATWGGTGLVSINVATDGTITILFTTAPGTVGAGALQVFLSGMSWRLKSL